MKALLLAVFCAASAFAQAPAASPTFEVASVKPADPHASGMQFEVTIADGLTATHISVGTLIQISYNLKPFLILGSPRWLDSEEFAIVAKPPAGTPPANPPKITDDFRGRVRALLADRFRLSVHHETREMPVYVLVVAKNGPKLKVGDPKQAFQLKRAGGGRILNQGGAKIGLLVTLFANYFDRPVLDETGLTGLYTFDLTWTPDALPSAPGQPQTANAADPGGPSLFTALQEQLGLKLESTRRPVEVLVIDRVERPTED
jgi:bla regulator protein blaR1